MPDLLLGLIGDNISRSRAPLLHRLAGAQSGLDVRYDLLVPRDLNQDFDAVFEDCARRGYHGLNVTYPYKEIAAKKVRCADPMIAGIGAVNTIVFSEDGAVGFNTDYSGFMAAYRCAMGEASPGTVCLIGTGGVGRAVAFGLLRLGVDELRLVDTDREKADGLAEVLCGAATGSRIVVGEDAGKAAHGAGGLVNCTPVGMHGHEGTPLPGPYMKGASWAFDAVYTPTNTQFLMDAAGQGIRTISGYELFFHQGVDAWKILAGRPLDEAALRLSLQAGRPDT